MTVHFLDVMMMDSVKKINGERSISAVYHLFRGKKSSQTIQDASLFNLTAYFGFYPRFTREQLNASIRKLEKSGIVHAVEDTYRITEQGAATLERKLNEKPWPNYYHGAHYQDIAKILWMRLSLLVQVLSNDTANCHQYVPIQRDYAVQLWVKNYLRHHPNRFQLTHELHQELETLLMRLNDKQALIFVYSLTSHERIGQTYHQLAEWINEDGWYVYTLFWDVIHYFIQYSQKGETPIIRGLIGDFANKQVLTVSTRRTLELVQKGATIDQIATIRSLKQATIEDHIVELSIQEPSFSIEPYIGEDEQKAIIHVAKKLGTNKMKRIKEGLNHQYSYFQIRLALTRMVKANG
ncbi:helix-turn-helix domain-containing protein [Bacillus sp. NPDC077027]|uniref:helix-turn-helix domain-containing protein n=1 Tax=Bacillus sp. NPDC077027 TaxID=3390548 RepID=UPI003CFFEE1C